LDDGPIENEGNVILGSKRDDRRAANCLALTISPEHPAASESREFRDAAKLNWEKLLVAGTVRQDIA
jgi:hypothetical protein